MEYQCLGGIGLGAENRILSFGIKGIEESLANTKGFKLLDGADDYSEDENV